ncbi:protein SNORC-like [Misgurnus anguillicaudatus]|uniref:protein SNORC-like n=1 Tax=Misgurnus anguillicaudatus TaxID=75329 RepID=UPI003CCF1ECF
MSISCVHFASSRLVLFTALAICMALVQTVADLSPALHNDNQDTLSGAGDYDITTKNPVHHLTENPILKFTPDYVDSTNTVTVNEEEGVLGPGAITAIVIAVFLGASVLLALIVITLRKFTAS